MKQATERDCSPRASTLHSYDRVPKHESWSDHLDGPDVMVRNSADFRLDDAHARADFSLLFSRSPGRYKGSLSDKAKELTAGHAFRMKIADRGYLRKVEVCAFKHAWQSVAGAKFWLKAASPFRVHPIH